jgi:hypothetical protein
VCSSLLSSGVTANMVCGAIAFTVLWDLAINNFTFQGFPEVIVFYTDKMSEATRP